MSEVRQEKPSSQQPTEAESAASSDISRHKKQTNKAGLDVQGDMAEAEMLREFDMLEPRLQNVLRMLADS